MSTRRRAILVASSLLVIATALAFAGNRDRVEQAIVPNAPYPGEPTVVACDPACTSFVVSVSPSLKTLVAEGNALAELGNARSRDVLELTVRMNRFQESADLFAELLEANPPPARLVPTIAEISTSIEAAQAAIDEAIAALRSFDWDELGIAVDSFDREIQNLIVLTDTLPSVDDQE